MRVRWTKDAAETFPTAGIRLSPGEKVVTDEQYAAIKASPWVEVIPEEPNPEQAVTETAPEEQPAEEPETPAEPDGSATETADDAPPAEE